MTRLGLWLTLVLAFAADLRRAEFQCSIQGVADSASVYMITDNRPLRPFILEGHRYDTPYLPEQSFQSFLRTPPPDYIENDAYPASIMVRRTLDGEFSTETIRVTALECWW